MAFGPLPLTSIFSVKWNFKINTINSLILNYDMIYTLTHTDEEFYYPWNWDGKLIIKIKGFVKRLSKTIFFSYGIFKSFLESNSFHCPKGCSKKYSSTFGDKGDSICFLYLHLRSIWLLKSKWIENNVF